MKHSFNFNQVKKNFYYSISLKWVLIIPFCLEILGAVGVVAYLSYRSGEESVRRLTTEIRTQTTQNIVQYLDNYLDNPVLINRVNADIFRLGYLNLNNPSQLEQYLYTQLQEFPRVSHIMVGTESGFFRVANRNPSPSLLEVNPSQPDQLKVYQVDKNGRKIKLINTFGDFNLKSRPWYRTAVEAKKPVRVPIFQLSDNSDLSLNSSHPIYEPKTGKLLGVFSAASDLTFLRQFIANLKVGQTGRVFILQKNGLLIGSSTNQLPFQKKMKNGHITLEQIKANESKDLLIRHTSLYLLSKFNNFQLIKKPLQLDFVEKENNQRHFVQVVPYQDDLGLDWLIVVVLPESDFTAEIRVNNQRTLALCFLTFVIATALGILTAKWINLPIFKISKASKILAQGASCEPLSEYLLISELQILTHSFNQMLEQVKQSFEQKEYRYQKLVEQQRDFILRSHPDTTITYANEALCQALGFNLEQIIGKKWTDFVSSQNLEQNYQKISVLTPENSSFVTENRDLRQNGTVGWTQWLNQGIFNEQGELIEIQSVGRDITKLKEIESALRESEARWQLAIEGVGDGTWDWNPQTNEVHFSRQWKAMLGYEEYQIGDHLEEWSSRVHPEDLAKCYTDIARYLRGETEIYYNEHRIRCKNGTYKWILDRGRVIERDDQGQPVRFIGTHSDISDRKMIELALQESEATFQKIAMSSPGIIYILVQPLNNQRYFEYISPATQNIYEYSVTQLLENFSLYDQLIYSEDLEGYEQAVAHSAENLAPFYYEWRIVTPSAKLKWIQAKSNPERRKNGDVAWYGFITDISERKETEIQMREIQIFLNSIIENIPNMVFVKDAKNLRFIRFNKAGEELLGYKREFLIGKNDYDLFPPQQAQFFTSKDREVLNSGKVLDISQETIQTKNGFRILHTKKLAILDEYNQPQYLLGISEDITEIKQAEIALKESTGKRRQTANMVMHIARGLRPIDPRFSFLDLMGIGHALCRLRLEDERATRQGGQSAHNQIGRQMQTSDHAIRQRSYWL